MSFKSDFTASEPVKNNPAITPVRPVAANPRPNVSPPPAVNRPVIHRWDEQNKSDNGDKKPMTKKFPKKLAGIFAGVVVAGLATGLAGAYIFPGNTQPVNVETTQEITENQIQKGAVFGVPDAETFADQTEGVLIKGGLEGEGSHTLLRLGGESQNVYLTSSVVDLDEFNDMEVRIWGETFKGQKAGWLMDVGRVEVLNTKGTRPDWFTELGE